MIILTWVSSNDGSTLGATLGIIDGDHVGITVGLEGFNDIDGETVVGITDGGDDIVGTIDGLYDREYEGSKVG